VRDAYKRCRRIIPCYKIQAFFFFKIYKGIFVLLKIKLGTLLSFCGTKWVMQFLVFGALQIGY